MNWVEAIKQPVAEFLSPWNIPLLQSVLSATSNYSLAPNALAACPGYVAENVRWHDSSIDAQLKLAGTACNVYGQDIQNLVFRAECQTEQRIHVQIYDPDEEIYQIPEDVLPRPTGSVSCDTSELELSLNEDPFHFSITRKSDGEVVFDTSGTSLIFQDQYWRLRTSLPDNPNLYGLGEHTDSLRLPTTNFTRTLWTRDTGYVPEGRNLYGAHPVYFENRLTHGHAATHGVALINSNGMDIKIDNSGSGSQYLEYNVLGGIIDLQFLAGPDPIDVAKQYSEVSGKANMMPYWGFGLHNCRFGYKSVTELEEVVANYSAAEIPLETMWTDIDYMDQYKIFTLGPEFPLDRMQKLVKQLHRNQQHYVLMVDPAVAYQDYGTFNRGKEGGVFLRNDTGDIYQGVVWPGVTAYPDWFHPDVQDFWNDEFARFFDPERGVDIDALWIDMNEPANFCRWPCTDPEDQARSDEWLASLGTSESVALGISSDPTKILYHPPKATKGSKMGLSGRDLLEPKYKTGDYYPKLSDHTVNTSVIHANGLTMYDTHNLFGTMMSTASHNAMLNRRPSRRAMVITRSTFMGAGTRVGHWLGDNVSSWHQYRQSIRHLLQFTALFQVPMAGADICGFAQDTNEALCARWVRLGAFYPFMRNHNAEHEHPQEFYRWPQVAEAARKAIDMRYRLLDYIYSALHKQTIDGTPLVSPLWMMYPNDHNIASIELQFFYGPALLVSPVTEEDSTEVKFYLPDDLFYDLETFSAVDSKGSWYVKHSLNVTKIPMHVRGGNIVAMRISSANTTTQLRQQDFMLVVAPNRTHQASGYLYLDDGDSLVQKHTSEIHFAYDQGKLSMQGSFGFDTKVRIASAHFLGVNNGAKPFKHRKLDWPLTGPAHVDVS